jgi:uncharacterized membrane protein YbhN (UPF0104 family)
MSVSSSRFRAGLTVLAVAALFAGLIPNRALLAQSLQELDRLSVVSIVALVAAVVVHRLTQSVMVAVITGRIRIAQALTANEAHSGCSLALVGGGAVGTGVKVAMLSGWGVEKSRIATSITATSVIPVITQWAMTSAAAAFFMLRGDLSLANQAAFGAGVVLSVGPAVFWITLLGRPGVVRWFAKRSVPALAFLARCRPLPLKWRAMLRDADPCSSAESLRVAALPLRGRRGLAAVGLAIASNILVGLILVLTLHGLDITASHGLYPIEAMAALALARTLGSFAPLPGGIGLLDAGLLASLAGHGVDTSSAVAAVALYRSATFVVPIVTGACSIVWWRRSLRRVNAS